MPFAGSDVTSSAWASAAAGPMTRRDRAAATPASHRDTGRAEWCLMRGTSCAARHARQGSRNGADRPSPAPADRAGRLGSFGSALGLRSRARSGYRIPVSYTRSTRSQAPGPAGTTASMGAGVPISPAAGAAPTRTLPAGTATRYVPSALVVALATSRPPGSRTTIVAPTTGRGAQAGSGGMRSTGQMGPAVATPTSHGPPLDGIGTGGAPGPPAVGDGSALVAGSLAGGPITAGSSSPVSPIFEAAPSKPTTYSQVRRLMQPAGQSPQPTWTVTRQPAASGVISYHDPWPTMPGSRAPIPEKRGSCARTMAAASAATMKLRTGVGVDADETVGAAEPAPPGALQATSRSPSTVNRSPGTANHLARATGRERMPMAPGR